MYKSLLRPLLFQIDPETIHTLSYSVLKTGFRLPLAKKLGDQAFRVSDSRLERKVFGLTFPNPIGLAAGFDKNALLVDEIAQLGFGFIEIGTVTPRPQPGNDKPRLFRLPTDQALINRMGFNNQGVEVAAARLKNRKSNIIVGGNIGKNKITPNEEALRDYQYCFDALFDVVDYFVVNVSSPNTPDLRALQDKEPLRMLLAALQRQNSARPVRKPLLLKIAPDLNQSQLDDIIEIAVETNLDGLVATNTTINREGLKTNNANLAAIGAGGLSGKPLRNQATDIIRYLRQHLPENIRIIGVGGIMTPEDALEKLAAGADLVQLYTGFIYEGPSLVKRINKLILKS
ncbi:quinone-dependent dihydroorotate dehydrogenase [Adhaeribacter rhizoryzae]|uniref:Dihydroorotate dehydrogenase (quinone) n=1 Tax=Adhaeribacter rhizoryzae TaxID=2607907 RepID=A0A5M6DKZ3_9BACT|nr:quinone-dependent dihydroorotate dehydrogenase [Adhaeribacter rhizoryzae]KAA5548201.1 quinone-dependent dihydroorotate dehydrogenase [Adhaeribacter rhizoryzae]